MSEQPLRLSPDYFDRFEEAERYRLGYPPSLLHTVHALVPAARAEMGEPSRRLVVPMNEFEYLRLETRAGRWGTVYDASLRIEGSPTGGSRTLVGSARIVCDSLNAEFVPIPFSPSEILVVTERDPKTDALISRQLVYGGGPIPHMSEHNGNVGDWQGSQPIEPKGLTFPAHPVKPVADTLFDDSNHIGDSPHV